MFAIKRNQVVITALVIMIAVAGYLNYIDGMVPQTNQLLLNGDGEIAALVPEYYPAAANDEDIGMALVFDDDPWIDTTYQNAMTITDYELPDTVETEPADAIPDKGNASDPGEAIFVNITTDSSYFVQAKLEREQSRAIQKDYILEVINNTNVTQEKRSEFTDEMLAIQKRIEKESAAESLLEAKGFNDVYVRIDDKTVDVIINKEVLSDAEVAQIEDAVKRKTGMNTDQIRISLVMK